MIPTEPIHIEDLAHQLQLNVNEIIEKISLLSLNGDVIISSGQMVSRYE